MAQMSKNRLDRLREQREKLNTRIQSVEARHKASERKSDIRKKILVGSYYLDMAIKDNKMNEIKLLMDTYLKRDSDRELFELEPSLNNKQ